MLKGLLIAYYFPPLNEIASHRLYSFAKYLNTSDCQLDVICPEWKGELKKEELDINIIYTSQRTFDRNFGEIKYTGIAAFRNFILNKCFKLNYFRSTKPGTFYKEVKEKLETINLKDYNFIITSFNPLDAIHIGKYVKEINPNIKWVIDYRDLYSLMEYYDMGLLRFLFKRFEVKLTKSADGFITVSNILKQKQEELIEKTGEVIYNGFEDYTIINDEKFTADLMKIGLPIISHAGSLYKGERDIRPFFKHLKLQKLDEKYCCVFALINDFDEDYLRKVIFDLNIKNVIIKRDLSFNQSLILQKFSSFLLLLTNFNGRGNGYLTGKVFEYIAAKKTIIYSGTTTSDFELYQLILKYQLGECFTKIDYNNRKNFQFLDSSFFHRKNQANELKIFLKKLIEK